MLQFRPADLDAIESFLRTRYASNPPPAMMAPFLALVISLHDRRLPLPSSDELARMFHCDVASIEAMRDMALSRKLIRIRPGGPRGHFMPSAILMSGAWPTRLGHP